MIEVEIKARIKNIEEVRQKVADAGAVFVKNEEQLDCIFGHPLMLDENKMVVEGGYAARIRQINNIVELTFKEIARGRGGIEIEANIGSVELGKSFLKRLGFEEAFMVHKHRDIFELDGTKIAMDKVELLGEFIEVEKVIDRSEKAEATQKECQSVLESLGIEYEIVTKKYGDLMQEIINEKNEN